MHMVFEEISGQQRPDEETRKCEKDLGELHAENPALREKFKAGSFFSCVSGRPFSSIALDQSHEFVNWHLKNCMAPLGSDDSLIYNLAGAQVQREVDRDTRNSYDQLRAVHVTRRPVTNHDDNKRMPVKKKRGSNE
eukprot:sb/3474633/